MENTENEGKRLFRSVSLSDDLIEHAIKLKTLGNILSALAWHESRPDNGSEALVTAGEALGWIIKDYAEAIEDIFNEIRKDEIAGLRGEWHEEVLEWIDSSKGGGGSAGVIDTHLEAIDRFIGTVAKPAFLLRNRFEEMKKKYPIKHNATVEAAAAAG